MTVNKKNESKMSVEKKFISTLMIAISNCSLYSSEHKSFGNLTNKILSMLDNIPGERFEIMIVDNGLVINKTPLRDAGLHGSNLIKCLKRKGITRLDFLKGRTLSEISQLIIDLSETARSLKSYPHIKTGTVDVNMSDQTRHSNNLPGSESNKDSPSYISSEEIEKLKDIIHNTSSSRKLNVAGLEEIVINFISNFKRESNILNILIPLKSYSEYTYAHAINVSLLTVFQAQTLGIRDELLHEVGIAALLHDVGKIYISKEILDKKGNLDENEFDEIKKHPIHGVRYLAKADGLTRLASVVAFEHHMKYDGSGYPQYYSNWKRQHLFSQIVAIADFFDAMRTRRPYRASVSTKGILAMIKKGSGKDFNPFLVDNFIKAMHSLAKNAQDGQNQEMKKEKNLV